MTRPRVFFPINTERFDVSAAARFGEPVFLIHQKNFSPFQPELILRICRSELRRLAFDVQRDFVAFTGPTNFVALLYGLVQVDYESARVLMFDARVNEYIERTVPAREPLPLRAKA